MTTNQVHEHSSRFSCRQSVIRRAQLLFGLTMGLIFSPNARASGDYCNPVYDPSTTYPALSRTGSATLSGDAGLFLYLLDEHALIETSGGCLHDVGTTTLVIEFGEYEQTTLVFELPEHQDGARVYVSEDGAWVETLELGGDSFAWVVNPGSSVGFEIAAPGQPAPTVPVVVIKPTSDGPEPS